MRVAGRWTYLYRAVDSAGDTIDFLLSPYRDRIAAKGFVKLALSGRTRPHVITVDGHPAYPSVINELRRTGQLGPRCWCRLPHLVELAHQAGLKIIVHAYSVEDFRQAISSGADEVAHVPGSGYRSDMPLQEFQISDTDAKAAAETHMKVTSTVSWLADVKEDDPTHFEVAKEEVVTRNLRLLKQAGVPILIGSDKFRRDVVPELNMMSSLGLFSNKELLNMDTQLTVQNMFPNRKVGRLQSGYEASFIVLRRDPTQDLANLSSITLRVKQGHKLTIVEAATKRPTPDCTQDAP